ncbi:MAG: GDP-mannose mannosyl hydrolase [Aeromonadaceae bacterium]|nr:GDP-mannose mannosyl hydrolase [Aeromonadaceae bacterium]
MSQTTTQGRLPDALFSSIIEHAPLISMDLVVRDGAGMVLLGKRLNRPAQGYWFVPGGRIRKGERFDAAFSRLVQEELGVELTLAQARFLGPYEHHYSDNVFGEQFSTHYVVLGFEVVLPEQPHALPCAQHGEYCWFPVDELLAAPDVHVHSKWYFQPHPFS